MLGCPLQSFQPVSPSAHWNIHFYPVLMYKDDAPFNIINSNIPEEITWQKMCYAAITSKTFRKVSVSRSS